MEIPKETLSKIQPLIKDLDKVAVRVMTFDKNGYEIISEAVDLLLEIEEVLRAVGGGDDRSY